MKDENGLGNGHLLAKKFTKGWVDVGVALNMNVLRYNAAEPMEVLRNAVSIIVFTHRVKRFGSVNIVIGPVTDIAS